VVDFCSMLDVTTVSYFFLIYMNRDEESYQLSLVCDKLFAAAATLAAYRS